MEESHRDTSRLVLPFPGARTPSSPPCCKSPASAGTPFRLRARRPLHPSSLAPARRVFVIVEDVGPNGPEGEVVFKPVLGWEEWLKTPEALDILLPPGTRRSDLSGVEYEAIKELTLESYDLREGPVTRGDLLPVHPRQRSQGADARTGARPRPGRGARACEESVGRGGQRRRLSLTPAPLCEWVVGQFEEEFEEGYEFTARELIDRIRGSGGASGTGA